MGVPGTRSFVVQALREAIPNLNKRDKEFAESLVSQWDRKGSLSKSQQEWVVRLTERGSDVTTGTMKPKVAERTVIQLGPLPTLFGLFEKSRASGVEFPVIRLAMEEGVYRLSPSRDWKTLHVSLNERNDEGRRPWVAGVTQEGAMTLTNNRSIIPQGLGRLLIQFNENPSAAGRVLGHKTKSCCFCGRRLDTTDSVYYGYGPICASKLGLEWGEAKTHIRVEKIEGVADFIKADGDLL